MRPRIVAAIERIASGHGCMRIPAEPNDPDLVLSDILNIIDGREPNPMWEEDDGYGSDFATAS
ncbi:hypothetical protein XccvBFoX4_gp53c [Xanthomonas phage FoX4]|uniref:Uncharacterized protein n=1 Tax=Xanthomonas phage FoX4 TaxID=2723900 RepID=A0A858WM00_9CAUD|nr:hypothetical protein KNU97_gp53 [Xanthomonas phage FoX4]QJI53007.1 hypothetical protein XccvBFoX4_gp53c [Xanthomonas phage FoX4]